MNNIEKIEAALEAVNASNDNYKPLHEEYLRAMSTAGGYEENPDHEAKPGELLTPAVILEMIKTGEMTKTGITNAITAGKIRKITAQKPESLIAAESALTGALDEYHRVCNEAVQAIAVKKTGRSRSSTSDGGVGANKQADVISAIHAMDPEATITFEGRRVTGTLSTGATFDYDAYGQSYLTSIAKMLKA